MLVEYINFEFSIDREITLHKEIVPYVDVYMWRNGVSIYINGRKDDDISRRVIDLMYTVFNEATSARDIDISGYLDDGDFETYYYYGFMLNELTDEDYNKIYSIINDIDLENYESMVCNYTISNFYDYLYSFFNS